MDTTSTLNTPEVSTATQQQQQQLSSYEDEALHDLASLFDPIHFLDDTVEFMEPQVTEQEVSGVNPPKSDDMSTWSEQVMDDILSMEHQHQHQQQQLTQPLALSNNTTSSTKKRRQGGVLKNTTNKKKKNGDKENHPPPTSSSSAAVATIPPPDVSRTKSEWPSVNLFPSAHPQPVRRSFSDTGANTSVSMEGVEPQRRRKRAVETRTVSTSTEEEECRAVSCHAASSNVRYKLKSKANLYESRAWKEVISKSKSGISYKSYLASGQIMLNTTVDKHTLEVQGTWMNIRGGNENNLPFKLPEILEFVSMIVHQDSSTPHIDHLIGNTIRMLTEDGHLRLLRGVRIISIDISTPEKFEQLREGCAGAYEVLLLLQTRHQQRRKLQAFLVNTPLPCSCPDGGSDHVRHYYYTSAVSSLEDVLPIEWVFKAYA